jgi:hypothetical protein
MLTFTLLMETDSTYTDSADQHQESIQAVFIFNFFPRNDEQCCPDWKLNKSITEV